jgi:hypothetical protein
MADEPTLDEFIDDPDAKIDALGEVDEVRTVRGLVDPELGDIIDDDEEEVVDEAFEPDYVTRPAEEIGLNPEPDDDID